MAIGMVMVMEKTPQGLSASALTTTSASTASRKLIPSPKLKPRIRERRPPLQRQRREQDRHDHQHADNGGHTADGAQLVAGHLAQRASAPACRNGQHQIVLHAAGDHRADDDPDGAGQIAHLGGQHRTHQRTRTGDGREVVTEQHPAVGRHVVGAVLEDLGRGGVVVPGFDDLHLDQPGIEPEADDVGADGGDDEPDRVDGLTTEEGDQRPGDGTDDGDGPENQFVPGGDGGAVDDRHRG